MLMHVRSEAVSGADMGAANGESRKHIQQNSEGQEAFP
jgi:hypothetical protein